MSNKRLRDEFAMAALTGLVSRGDCPTQACAAQAAYNLADAMLEEREVSEIRKVQARRREQLEEERARVGKYFP